MTLISFLLLTVIALTIGYAIFQLTSFDGGHIAVAPVYGLMLGFHYNTETYTTEKHHTLQFSFFLVMIELNWFFLIE